MTTSNELRALLERVEGGSGGDRDLDQDVFLAFGKRAGLVWWRNTLYTSSVDDAVALVEKVLPGWVWTMAHWWCEGDDKPPFFADLGELEKLKADDGLAIIANAWATSPARALVAALLRAKLEQEDGNA